MSAVATIETMPGEGISGRIVALSPLAAFLFHPGLTHANMMCCPKRPRDLPGHGPMLSVAHRIPMPQKMGSGLRPVLLPPGTASGGIGHG
ncbi:MAG: hypothetical protein HQL73_05690 [Magnetococcales bacterium]|nr:hypothetical protein [Magnetococcales bacterium]